MVEIAQRLRDEDYRFVKIAEGKKYPFEDDWTDTNNYSYDKPELSEHLDNGDNYGVATGYGDLTVIDCDVEEVEKAVLKGLPRTYQIRTGGGGAHFYFKCDLEDNIRLAEGDAQGDAGDVQYKGKQVVGPNSVHPSGNRYTVEVDTEIAEVSETEIKTALHPWISTEEDDWKEITDEKKEDHGVDYELDITDVLDVSQLRDKGGGQYQGSHILHDSTTGQNFCVDTNKNVWYCHRHDAGGGPEHWIAVKHDIIDCSEAVEGALDGPKFKEVLEVARDEYGVDLELNNTESGDDSGTKVVTKIDTDELLADEIYTDEDPKLAYMKDGELKTKDKIELDGTTYKPRIDEVTEKGIVKLPTDIEDYGTTEDLLEEIRKIIHKHVDVSDKYEKLASWYVIMTWCYDELSTVSYLRALGDTGTGKSRLLDVVGNMCYKPITISGAVSPAPIYRLLEQWKGTLLVDEGDLRNSDAMNEVVTILNCGFERNKSVMRCDSDDYDKLRFFDVFGPKIIATRQEFHDKALESRCLTEKMSQTIRTDILDQLPKSFFDKAEEIRNKCLKWRFDNKDSVDVEKTRDVYLGKVSPRLKQATRGFLAVFDGHAEIKQELIDFLREHQKELIEQKAETWEGMVITTIYEKWQENNEEEIQITPGQIADSIQESYGEKKISAGHVGRKLRSLNLETERQRIEVEGEKKRRRVLIWDEDLLEILFRRYVPGYAGFIGDLDNKDTKSDITNYDGDLDSKDSMDSNNGSRGFDNNNIREEDNKDGQQSSLSPMSCPSCPSCPPDDFDDTLGGRIKSVIKELDNGKGVHQDKIDDNIEADFDQVMDEIVRLETDGALINRENTGMYSLNGR